MIIGPEFVGLEPWRPGSEIIECVVDGEVFDLHNTCTLNAIRVQVDSPLPVLQCQFAHDSGREFFLIVEPILDLVMGRIPMIGLSTRAPRQTSTAKLQASTVSTSPSAPVSLEDSLLTQPHAP